MRVLGIDPGTRIVGFGIVGMRNGTAVEAEFGEIRVPQACGFPERLKAIHDAMLELIDRVRPDAVSVEETYVTSNAKTTLRLGHARGVILLAAAIRGIPVAEYAPREIKAAVTGNGAADKSQVQWMVCQLMKLEASRVSEDAGDALAAAMCHAYRCGKPDPGGNVR